MVILLAGVATGCSGDSSPAPTESTIETPSMPEGTTYDSPTDMIAAITAEVVPCKPQDGPTSTLYSDRAQTCWYTASDGVDDLMTAATYASAAQQADAVPYLQDTNPGAVYVQGNGWTVRTSAELAEDVAAALDGEVTAVP